MNPTLAELIQSALNARQDAAQYVEGDGTKAIEYEEAETLANNALEEAITNLIDTRIAKALNDIKP